MEQSRVDEHRFLTIAEFAERLRISAWSARWWCKSGQVAFVRIGRRLLISEAEVDRLIAMGTQVPVERRSELSRIVRGLR